MSEPGRDQPREHREAAALLASGAARARAGSGGVVLVRGATGTGRTTVLENAAEEAALLGMRVLRARCSPGDATVPFAAALQLLGPLTGFDELDTPGSERERAALLCRVLQSYADQSPLLLAVDDIHHADPSSRRWLVECARHADRLPLPVLLAVTERSQYDIDPPGPGFAHNLPPARVRAHTLLPLSAASAAELVRAEFPAATEAWVDNCVRAGAGSPLLLRALLRDLADLADLGAPDGLPDVPETSAALHPGAYLAAARWWLESAGPGTAEVARFLAALDEACDDEVVEPGVGPESPPARLGPPLGELTGTDPARVTGWLTAMTHLGVLQRDLGPGPHRPAGPAAPGTSTRGIGAGSEPVPYDGPDPAGSGPAPAPAPGAYTRLTGTGSEQGPYNGPGQVPYTGPGQGPYNGTRPAGPGPGTALSTFRTEDGPGRRTADGRLRYTHSLLRDALLTGMPPARRREVHRIAAEAMLHLGVVSYTVGRELVKLCNV
ncbi:AAA family ATPase, partial [Streptomyces sp. NPDC055078]